MAFVRFATIFTPQGDGNSIFTMFRSFTEGLRHDIYPARGRKLFKRVKIAVNRICDFATIFTPQGDGNTLFMLPIKLVIKLAFATIFTPQGDGNVDRALDVKIDLFLFATIFTPQGDGNYSST